MKKFHLYPFHFHFEKQIKNQKTTSAYYWQVGMAFGGDSFVGFFDLENMRLETRVVVVKQTKNQIIGLIHVFQLELEMENNTIEFDSGDLDDSQTWKICC
jgi:hypothetical protein